MDKRYNVIVDGRRFVYTDSSFDEKRSLYDVMDELKENDCTMMENAVGTYTMVRYKAIDTVDEIED